MSKKPDLTGYYASQILNIMEERGSKVNTPGIKIGQIKSVEPLLVTVNGADLNDKFVTIAESLRPHERQCKLEGFFDITGSWNTNTVQEHSHNLTKVNGNGKFKGKVYFTDYGFEKDDIVLLLSENDEQHFYIIQKIGGKEWPDNINI